MFVTAIVVTYNRPALLIKVLGAIDGQSRKPDQLLVIDNGSGQETVDALAQFAARTALAMTVVRSEANVGGAGGFALGMQSAPKHADGWLWVMDDDAEPSSACLEQLLALAQERPRSIIGPAAVGHAPDDGTLCWPAARPDGSTTRRLADMEAAQEVFALPFLGLLVPSAVLEAIGLPESRLFISGDDVDFTMRARKAGYPLYLQPTAILHHPLPTLVPVRLGRRTIWLQHIPAWKRYFEVRNRLWVARQHHGRGQQLGVLVVTLYRMAWTLPTAEDRSQQVKAYYHGMVDGMLGRLDRRPLGPH